MKRDTADLIGNIIGIILIIGTWAFGIALSIGTPVLIVYLCFLLGQSMGVF